MGEQEMNKLVHGLIGLVALCVSASAFAGAPVHDIAVAVPEPGTLGLLAAGIVVAVAVRLRSRK
jgi:hypothetical protein